MHSAVSDRLRRQGESARSLTCFPLLRPQEESYGSPMLPSHMFEGLGSVRVVVVGVVGPVIAGPFQVVKGFGVSLLEMGLYQFESKVLG